MIALASGCSVLEPQEDHTRYFVLTPTSGENSTPPAKAVSTSHDLLVGLGPITLPQYLERPEVITRLSDTEFSASNNDRWGEPLDASVLRVLAQDLASHLPNSEIVAFPWSKKAPIDYRISVEFRRLERTADGRTVVQAVWTLRTGSDNRVLRTGTTTAIGSAGNDQSSASAALSQGVGQLSAQIAAAVETHIQQETAAHARI